MSTAHRPAEPLSATSNQSIAPFLRRLGNTVRGAVAGGIGLAARLRRSAAPSSATGSAVSAPRSTAPKPLARRQPDAMPPVSAARPGWFARCFGPARSRSAPPRPPRRADSGKLFTRKAYANLPPEIRAILNTPLQECDPVLVRLLFAALAQDIAACLPPEAEMTEAQKMYAQLWGGLIAKLVECGLDDAPADPPPESAARAAPAEPPPESAAAGAPAEPPPEPSPAAAAPGSAPVGIASAVHRGPVPFNAGRAFRPCRPALLRRWAWALCSLGPPAGGFLHGEQPPPRRLCYAACAGPP